MISSATSVSVQSTSNGFHDKNSQRGQLYVSPPGASSFDKSSATSGIFYDDPKTGKPMPMGSARSVPLPKLGFLKVGKNSSPTHPLSDNLTEPTSFQTTPNSSAWLCRFCTYANVDFCNKSCALCGKTMTVLENPATLPSSSHFRGGRRRATSGESSPVPEGSVSAMDRFRDRPRRSYSEDNAFPGRRAARRKSSDESLGSFQAVIPGPPELRRATNDPSNPNDDICPYEPSVLERTSSRVFSFLRREKKFERRKSNDW